MKEDNINQLGDYEAPFCEQQNTHDLVISFCAQMYIPLCSNSNYLISLVPLNCQKNRTQPKTVWRDINVYPQVKFLGITFDSQLNFEKHFEDILDCCNTRYHRLRLSANQKWGP